MNKISMAIALVLCSGTVYAVSLDELSPEIRARVMTNMADDMANCAAFYRHIVQCLENSNSDSAQAYEAMGVQALKSASTYLYMSNVVTLTADQQQIDHTKLMESSGDSVLNWFNRDYESMLAESKTCGNISILYTQHLESCNAYLADTDVLTEKWINKITSEESQD